VDHDFTQRGSLVYVGTIFVVFVAAEGTALFASSDWQISLDAWQTPMQLVVAPIMIIAGIFAVRAQALHRRRAGLGDRTRHGRPVRDQWGARPRADADPRRDGHPRGVRAGAAADPRAPGEHNASVKPILRAILAVAVGATMAMVAMVATGARVATPISERFPDLAYELGHGKNVVNVASSTCAAGTRWESCRS
jgi:multicomponent Na+:H+ antiporter subunit A